MANDRAALYCRLSKEDGEPNESISINTQKLILTKYAVDHGWKIVDCYVDDGYTGTNFNRPDFQRMLRDIEKGLIDIVIVKDLSRFGRHYIMTGFYSEMFFQDHNVRFISVGENIDTATDDNDIAPFRNILNEYYARDVSRKTKAAFRAKARNGEFLGSFAPYGYQKQSFVTGSSADKHKLVIDAEAAAAVRRIFEMCADGAGYTKIAETLNAQGTLNPTDYINKIHSGFFKSSYHQKDHIWNPTTVRKIIGNPVYLGAMAQGKKAMRDYRSKKIIMKPPEQWIVVEHTHDPIISQELWDKAHESIDLRKKTGKTGQNQIFTGLLKCAGCGYALTLCRSKKTPYFICSQYRIRGKQASCCSSHYIQYPQLCESVVKQIQRYAKMSAEDESEAIATVTSKLHNKYDGMKVQSLRQITKLKQQIAEFDEIIQKAYADYAREKLTQKLFSSVYSSTQQKSLQAAQAMAALQAQIDEADRHLAGVTDFVYLIRRFSYVKELDAEILNTLIDKIIVYEKDDGPSERIEIYFKFVGCLP